MLGPRRERSIELMTRLWCDPSWLLLARAWLSGGRIPRMSGGGPGVAAHDPCLTMLTKSSWIHRSPVSSGGRRWPVRSLAGRDDLTGARLGGEDLGVLADPLGPRGADEHAAVGAAVEPCDGRAGLERVDLAGGECVRPDGRVDRAECFLAAGGSASRPASVIMPAQDPKTGIPEATRV